MAEKQDEKMITEGTDRRIDRRTELPAIATFLCNIVKIFHSIFYT
jgi:hypothetical protein